MTTNSSLSILARENRPTCQIEILSSTLKDRKVDQNLYFCLITFGFLFILPISKTFAQSQKSFCTTYSRNQYFKVEQKIGIDAKSLVLQQCLDNSQVRTGDCQKHLKCPENAGVAPLPAADIAAPVSPRPDVNSNRLSTVTCSMGRLQQIGEQRNLVIANLLESCLTTKSRLHCLAKTICDNELVVKYLSRCEARLGNIISIGFGLNKEDAISATHGACSTNKNQIAGASDLCALNLSCSTVANRLDLDLETKVEGSQNNSAPPQRPTIEQAGGPPSDRVITTPRTPLPGRRPEPIPSIPESDAPF